MRNILILDKSKLWLKAWSELFKWLMEVDDLKVMVIGVKGNTPDIFRAKANVYLYQELELISALEKAIGILHV